jgi:hypothetical protein
VKRNDRQPRIEVISVESARKLLDRRARRLLGISGEEFLRRFNAGELDYEQPGVFALATLADLVRT